MVTPRPGAGPHLLACASESCGASGPAAREARTVAVRPGGLALALAAGIAAIGPAAIGCHELSNDCALNLSCTSYAIGGAGGGATSGGSGSGASTGGGAAGDCGDGVLQLGEGCDDHNTATGDGCHDCQVELGWTCRSEPTICIPGRRPYFMIAFDTSGSMTIEVGAPPMASSCGFGIDRLAHGRCVLQKILKTFDGQVRFGLSTFAVQMEDCTAACFADCVQNCWVQEQETTGACAGCGPLTGAAATRAGAVIRVPIASDNPPAASNLQPLLSWMDNTCADSHELFAIGNTPLNGTLRDMRRYFESGWTAPDGAVTFPTPLAAGDKATGAACLSVNVLLITDGDETCDTQIDAVAAAAQLYDTGVTVAGETFHIRTFVINFAGGTIANTDAIAAAGGTGASYFATDELSIKAAIESILASGGCN